MSWLYRRPDRERGSSLPPLDVRERGRLALRGLFPVIAFFWFREQPEDVTGSAAALAIFAAVAAESAVSLLWLPSSPPSERIFTRTRREAAVVNAAVLVASSVIALIAWQRLT